MYLKGRAAAWKSYHLVENALDSTEHECKLVHTIVRFFSKIISVGFHFVNPVLHLWFVFVLVFGIL